MRQTGWNLALGLVALLCVVLFYALAIIRNFSGPIGDYGESFLHEYLPWFAAKHLTFWPVPHLNLHTDEVLYPFGGNVALQSWCVERDILFALLQHHFPQAPLLQLYYLLGVALSTLGSYLLLLPRHRAASAALTTVIAHAFNFYSMQKYAYHFNIACYHWTTLGIVCDFVLVETMVKEHKLSVRLLSLRLLLLVLAFGLELGHVLGFSLTSVLFASVYLVWFAYREQRAHRLNVRDLFSAWREEARQHRVLLMAMGVMTLSVAWLYGAVTAGIVWDSLTVGRFTGQGGVWWAQPLRLLIPYTPWLHPLQPKFANLGDHIEVEAPGGGSGLFLLIIASIGIYQSRAWRLRSPYFWLLAMLGLYAFSGSSLPLLKLLPWFHFCRVLSRPTLVYSTILALLAVNGTLAMLPLFRRKIATAALLGLALLELYTMTGIKDAEPHYSFSQAQREYLDTIQKLPGEAILDFPFCLSGGNGDIAGLCPYWSKLKGVYALQRFHEKKVIGQYLGRLHPSQAAPFVRQGWDLLNEADSNDITRATIQTRCLSPKEWEFFEQFFRLHDFAGLQLATDRLPPGCKESFYARFGNPIASMELMNAGHLELIPKPAALRALVDPVRGKQLELVSADPGPITFRFTALDLQRSGETAVQLRNDEHGQPTRLEFLEGRKGVVFGPYATLPAGEYVVGFDLELTSPPKGRIATVDMHAALWNSILGQVELTASHFRTGRRQIEFPATLPIRTSRLEFRVLSQGAGLLLHGVTVRRLGPPKEVVK